MIIIIIIKPKKTRRSKLELGVGTNRSFCILYTMGAIDKFLISKKVISAESINARSYKLKRTVILYKWYSIWVYVHNIY